MNNRYTKLSKIYTDVFMGKSDYIPLIISPPCLEFPSVDEFWIDSARAVKKCIQALEPKIEVGSDWLPTVEIGTYQGALIPGFYGAKIIKQDGSDPMGQRCFACLAEAIDVGIPAIKGWVLDKMLEDLHTAQKILPEGYFLSFAAVMSPFDLAQLMLGGDFLISLLTNPEEAKMFLQNLADLAIRIIKMIKLEMGQDDQEYITNRGMYFPGFRLPCDAIVNYSPEIIEKIVVPILSQFSRAFGPLCIHICTKPAPSGHVMPAFLESNEVRAIDNWQGIDDFIGEEVSERMQSKIAIVSDVDLSSPEKINVFLSSDPIRRVPRKGGRGIVIGTSVESVEDGKRVYNEWRSKID